MKTKFFYKISGRCYMLIHSIFFQGTKLIKQLDLEVVGHYFMGERFFHGKFKVMMDFFTAKENVTCYSVIVELMDTEKLKQFRKKLAEKQELVTK